MPTVPNVTLNDGRTIPQFGFGVWQIDPDDIVDAVGAALRAGYRHIDTASMYGNEEGVGQAFRESGLDRDDVWITTKLGNPHHNDPAAALDESLQKLRLDHVDLYLIHWPLPKNGEGYVEVWKTLVDLQKAGRARSIGVSNFQPNHLDAIIDASGVTPAVNQVEIHPTLTQAPLVADVTGRGIAVESWTPLGKGDIELDVIGGIAERLGATPAQVILAWHLAKGYIVFPKSVTPSRIEENLAAIDVELTADDIAVIDQLDAGNRVGPDPDTFTG